MEFDSRLSEVGDLGRWQWCVLLLLIPPATLPGMWSVVFIFSGYVPDHRCHVNSCDTENSSYIEPWLNFTVPAESQDVWSSCSVYNSSDDDIQCLPDEFINSQIKECQQFVFDNSIFKSTVVTEFNLVCDEGRGQVLVDLGYSMYSIGVLLGVLVPGFLSDKFGRKRMMFLSIAIEAISTLGSAFATDYTTFLVLRVAQGVGTLGTFLTMCILSVEITTKKHKSLVGNIVHFGWAPGQMLLALMAYFIRDWRTLHIAVSVPVFLSLLLYPLIPESPRWLFATGKEKEGNKVLQQVARINKRPLPVTDSSQQPSSNTTTDTTRTTNPSFMSLMSSPGVATTTIVLSINWLVVDFAYYGLSLNSVNLAGDIFVNFVLSALVEIPAVLLGMLGMDWVGRVVLLVSCQLLGGISCILAGLLPTSSTGVLIFSLLGKMSASIVFLIVYLYTTEIYPTNVRGMGLAITATMARIGGFLAPFIAGLGVKNSSIPFLIFGGTAIFGGGMALLLPETKGAQLPNTLQDVEEIMKNKLCCRGKTTTRNSHKTYL